MMQPRGRSDPGQGSGPPQYSGAFLLAFGEAAGQVGWEFLRAVRDVAQCRDAEGREHHIGLENLYRRARLTPRADWPTLIAEFLRTIAAAEVESEFPERLSDVADRLLLRLGVPFRPPVAEAAVWSLPLPGTSLSANLVIDYPDRMSYVTEQLVAESGESGQFWLDRARANLLARTPAECFDMIHEESGLRICTVADAYDSSRAFLLEELLPEQRENGYLLIIPGRDELLVLPVTTQALPHLHLLKVLAEKNFKSVPYPISDEVYWLHHGVFHPFSMAIKGNEVAVQPPPEFVEMLDRLAGRAGPKEENHP